MLRAVTRRTEVVLGRRRRTWGYLREMHREGGWTWDQFDTDIHAFEFDAANAAREVTR
jgi:ribosomal protein S10